MILTRTKAAKLGLTINDQQTYGYTGPTFAPVGCVPVMTELEEEMFLMLQAIRKQRDHCFIPNYRPGLTNFDDRLDRLLTKIVEGDTHE